VYQPVPRLQNAITVQHGSAETVVMAMNVKYRKWRLGGVL